MQKRCPMHEIAQLFRDGSWFLGIDRNRDVFLQDEGMIHHQTGHQHPDQTIDDPAGAKA